MPQLNPNPWFLVFIVSWATLITLSLVKSSKYRLLSNPTPKQLKTSHTHWTWPWP